MKHAILLALFLLITGTAFGQNAIAALDKGTSGLVVRTNANDADPILFLADPTGMMLPDGSLDTSKITGFGVAFYELPAPVYLFQTDKPGTISANGWSQSLIVSSPNIDLANVQSGKWTVFYTTTIGLKWWNTGNTTGMVNGSEVIRDPESGNFPLDTANIPTAESPTITQHPGSVVAPLGGNGSFTIAYSSAAPETIVIDWFRQGDSNPIAGQHSSTLSFSGITDADAGSYFAVVTDALGTATSESATLTIGAVPNVPAASTATLFILLLSMGALGSHRALRHQRN